MTAHLRTHILWPQNIQAPLEKRPLTWAARTARAAPHWALEVKTAQRVAGCHDYAAGAKASLTSSAQMPEPRSSEALQLHAAPFMQWHFGGKSPFRFWVIHLGVRQVLRPCPSLGALSVAVNV